MPFQTTDPVCGMEVDSASPRRAEHRGTTYLFCSDGCRTEFEAAPEKYLDAPAKDQGHDWRAYIPLLVVIGVTLLAAAARSNDGSFMHDFMGFFLVVFAMLKLFDLPAFADGFQRYDLLAKPFRPYALLYPFLELALGLAYLAHWHPRATYIVTVLLMSFGTLGVVHSLARGQKIHCACMGTVLKVPLSTVAVVENLGMVLMAGAMLAISRAS